VDLCDLDRGDLARTASRRRSHRTTAGARLTVCAVGPIRRNSRWTVAPPVRRTRNHPSPGRLPDRRRHRWHQCSPGDGQPHRLPHGRHRGRALARRAPRAYSPTAGLGHPTNHLRVRSTDQSNVAGATGDGDPAIHRVETPLLTAYQPQTPRNRNRTDADGLDVPKTVPNGHENGPRRSLRGPFPLVAGTGFEPATSGL
jgi:hypothetical protein